MIDRYQHPSAQFNEAFWDTPVGFEPSFPWDVL